VKNGGTGIARFAPLFLASLLLHLAFIIAAISSVRQETVRHHISTNMVVEYVTDEKKVEKQVVVMPPAGILLPATKETRIYGTNASPVTASRQISAAVISVLLNTPASDFPKSLTDSYVVTPVARSEGDATVSLQTAVSGTSTGRKTAASVVGTMTGSGTNEPAQASSAPRRATYQALLKRLIDSHKEYPLAARKNGREGSCQRRFVLGRNGSLKHVEAVSSCGHVFLDEAATRAVTSVGTFPPLPDAFGGAEETFTITMTFALAR
jgi:protein TonB